MIDSGRFEDWSYAASWFNKSHNDTESSHPVCTPQTYGGYLASKTIYDDSMLRSISFLIETSMNDEPPTIRLGRSKRLVYIVIISFYLIFTIFFSCICDILNT